MKLDIILIVSISSLKVGESEDLIYYKSELY